MNKKDNNKDDNRRIRTIITIIIIIIIILLLITCCNSKKLGFIGNMFNNEGSFIIDKDTNDLEIILNKDLIFDTKNSKIFLNDDNLKISYSYKNINPKKFTCKTSNAKIATCQVKKGYIIVKPKGTGKVEIILDTKVNGKIYRATTNVTIKKSNNKYLALSSTNGTIDLYKNKTAIVTYTLVGIEGKVTVKIDNKDIADVKIVDGVLKVTAKKKGKAKITLTVKSNGKTYTVTYDLTVIDTTPSTSKNSSNNTTNSTTKDNNKTDTTTQKKSNDSTLKNLTTSKGTLNFSPNKYYYYLSVPNTTDKLTLHATPNNNNSKVTYEVNGKKVNDLTDIELKEGENKVKVTVEAEDGTKTTYEVTITREKNKASTNNYLDNLLPNDSDLNLNEEFNRDNLNYTMDVPFKKDKLSLNATPEDNKSKTTYKLNGKKINDLSNLELKPGNNELEITVESESGETRTYTVNIYRAERKIELSNDKYIIYLDNLINGEYKINYEIYEFNKEQSIFIKTDDYTLDEVSINLNDYSGTFEVSKDYLTLTPDNSMFNKQATLTINHYDISDTATIDFKLNDYSITPGSSSYEFNVNEDKSIVLNNNLFQGEVTVEEIPGGIRIRDKNNPDIYIDIIGDISIEYVEGTDSIVINVNSNEVGSHTLTVTGTVHGQQVSNFDISINVITEYIVTLDANGGFYNELTAEYNLKLKNNTPLTLNDYIAYKVDPNDECKYLKIIGYGERKDTKATDSDFYSIDTVLTITKSITLYAIYETTSTEEVKPDTNKWLYLTEVDLFHNEEYYQLFKKDKYIYPGAHGSYIMNITNNTGKDITIENIKLNELKTICTYKGCINMGYQILSNGTYYLGKSEEFSILHPNNNQLIPINIKVPNNNKIDIALYWKWVEQDDELDTEIGNSVKEDNNEYSLSVGIEFSSENSNCPKE